MKLNYKKLGKGQPLIMLHGVFGSSDNLLSVGKSLAENFSVYLLDQRNHGESPHSDSFTYSDMAEDVNEFMEDHNINNAFLLGHSMGGKTVMNFTAKYPEKVKKLIVVDISPRYYRRHHDDILEGLNSIQPKVVSSRGEADKILSEKVSELAVRQFLLKNLEREGDSFKWRINLQVISRDIENVGEALPESAVIKVPTLFVKGENSGYIREKDIEVIDKQFSNYKLEIINGAGHWLHAEKPIEFVKAVKSFLEKNEL